ncbi:MAG: hypothetical protein CME43_11275 [Haliea sp.]|mgnify:FL=1|nr:hypothetical protein [Haliea sp.]
MPMLKIISFAALLYMSSAASADSDAVSEAAELIRVMGLEQGFEPTMSQMLEVQLQQYPAMVPYRHVLLKFYGEHMSFEALKPDILRLYAEAFTAAELREIRHFYQTEVGRKVIATMPMLMAKSAELGSAHLQDNMGELYAMIDEVAASPLQEPRPENDAGRRFPGRPPSDEPFPEMAETDLSELPREAMSHAEIAEVNKRCEGYRYGMHGYPDDQALAVKWCTQSAELDNPYGQSILGALYYNGAGVPQSYRDALYWFTLAANRGMPYASFVLFQMYQRGQGTEIDQDTAFMYLSRSAELGGEEAKNVFAEFKAQVQVPDPSEDEIQKLLDTQGVAKFAPTYPLAAQAFGIEGYVIVAYCIGVDGRPMNIRVIESVPQGLFDEASIAATENFHYAPTLEDGVAVERHGVQNKFTFKLDPPAD